ncbi:MULTISPECIES: ABC transporter substrate-binding protein [Streptacidiphilus]|uniref:Extracellular solute-binding protein n=1 Tax=Streptacidiphilus cavernicola TaxID=3342716 RepID=A0ABV6UZD4_9ACTN|nr:ABC transporter substrate-binding protein [Streptacidiphilus jeojiense]
MNAARKSGSPSRSPRRGLALTMAAGVALTAGACSSGAATGSAPAGPLTLTATDYYTSEPMHSAVGSILTSCAASTGVKVTHVSVANPQLMPKALQQLSSHTLPDLLMLDNPSLQQIAQTGALVPLDTAGVDLSGVYPSILSAGSYQGKVYGLAPGVNSIALFYNKDMLSAAGIKPPTTWAELTADAAKLTTPKRYGFAMSADNDGEGAWQYLPFFWSNGGDLQHLDAAPSVQSLQLVSGLVKSGSMSKSVVTWAQSDVNDQFIAGKAAMMINGPWQFPTLDAAKGLHYGVAPIPVPTAGAAVKVPLGGEVWTVPVTSSAKEKAAAKVLACMNTGANQVALAKAAGYVPSLQSAAAQVAKDTPALAPFVTEVSTALSRTAVVGTKYPAIATALETAMQSALTGAASPQAALTTAQSAATKG